MVGPCTSQNHMPVVVLIDYVQSRLTPLYAVRLAWDDQNLEVQGTCWVFREAAQSSQAQILSETQAVTMVCACVSTIMFCQSSGNAEDAQQNVVPHSLPAETSCCCEDDRDDREHVTETNELKDHKRKQQKEKYVIFCYFFSVSLFRQKYYQSTVTLVLQLNCDALELSSEASQNCF